MTGLEDSKPDGRLSQYFSKTGSRQISICSRWSAALLQDETTQTRQAMTPLEDLIRQLDQKFASHGFDGNLLAPPQVHLSKQPSQRSSISSAQTSYLSEPGPLKIREFPTSCKNQSALIRLRDRFVEGFRKNYCPRRPPVLVLPSAPTDSEKYCYTDMKRVFLVTCATTALLSLAVGAWMFAKAAPIYSWYAVYVFVTQVYLFISLFITIFGKKFDVSAHRDLLGAFPLDENTAPTVDIYLPVCNEPLELLRNTWRCIAKLQYPASKISVFVLDDGASESVRTLAQRFEFGYICRPNRPDHKKAGNLRHAFAQTSGEFFTVFDADFCPRSDFLLETMPYMLDDEKRAIVQTTQFFRSRADQTWVEQGAGAVQEYIYRVTQSCKDRWGAAICVGSNAIYRRAALEPVGGTVAADHTEDIYTGYYVTTHGWTLKNIPLVLACGACPNTPSAFFSQQLRWCSGSVAMLLPKSFWTSSLSVQQKLCYLIGLIYYVSSAVQPILSPIPAPLILWTRPDLFKYYNMFFAFPSLALDLVALRIWTRTRYTLSVQYAQTIMSYAYLQGIFDLFTGSDASWVPSGKGGKAHRNRRYRNMRVLACGWTITHNSVLTVACVYRVAVTGMAWYQLVPALVIDAFNLLCVHRFLLYRHPRD